MQDNKQLPSDETLLRINNAITHKTEIPKFLQKIQTHIYRKENARIEEVCSIVERYHDSRKSEDMLKVSEI